LYWDGAHGFSRRAGYASIARVRQGGVMPARRLGTARDAPSARDWRYDPRPAMRSVLPDAIDLRRHCPPVYDQRHLNSCSANAIAAAMRYDEIRTGRRLAPPSRLFIYYNERMLDGEVRFDDAVPLRDGYRAVARFGACSETLWPYDPRRFRRAPTAACYHAARRRVAVGYYRIRRALSHLRACLAERYPFVFAVAVHRSLLGRRVARTGIIPIPGARDPFVGGHALLAVGYDHPRRLFLVRNSWGARWGDRGYGYLPY
jgi:C1A family cysteine protease